MQVNSAKWLPSGAQGLRPCRFWKSPNLRRLSILNCMKLLRYSLAKVTAAAFCLLLLLATTAPAQNDRPDKKAGFAYRHQAGARLGVWANLGDLPARSGG